MLDETELPSISQLTTKQLKQLIDAANDRLIEVEETELQATLEKMQEIMETTGFDFRQVFAEMIDGMRKGKSPKTRKPRAAPKYRDPDTGKTWTGKGRTPAWMQPHLDGGKNKEDFLIAKALVDEVV